MPRKIGIEEELLLVDPDTGTPTAVSDPLLSVADGFGVQTDDDARPPTRPTLEHEAKQEQIEVVSPPCRSLDEVADMVIEGRRRADQAARAVGARAVALATSVSPVSSLVVPEPRYEAILHKYGLTMKEQLTCGMHIHVEVENDDEGVGVLDRVRPWLPTLLALSSNSPLWGGNNTGYASYRYQAWSRWPSAGAYDIFDTADAYRDTLRTLVGSGVLLDTGMVYFDARLCENYPTVEVRVADVCMDAEHAVAIAGLTCALVETAARDWRDGREADPLPTSLLRLAMWSASRFGTGRTLVHPQFGRPCDAREAVDALLTHVEPVLVEANSFDIVAQGVERILTHGTGAERQCEIFSLSGRPDEVVRDAIEMTNRAENGSGNGVPTQSCVA